MTHPRTKKDAPELASLDDASLKPIQYSHQFFKMASLELKVPIDAICILGDGDVITGHKSGNKFKLNSYSRNLESIFVSISSSETTVSLFSLDNFILLTEAYCEESNLKALNWNHPAAAYLFNNQLELVGVIENVMIEPKSVTHWQEKQFLASVRLPISYNCFSHRSFELRLYDFSHLKKIEFFPVLEGKNIRSISKVSAHSFICNSQDRMSEYPPPARYDDLFSWDGTKCQLLKNHCSDRWDCRPSYHLLSGGQVAIFFAKTFGENFVAEVNFLSTTQLDSIIWRTPPTPEHALFSTPETVMIQNAMLILYRGMIKGLDVTNNTSFNVSFNFEPTGMAAQGNQLIVYDSHQLQSYVFNNLTLMQGYIEHAIMMALVIMPRILAHLVAEYIEFDMRLPVDKAISISRTPTDVEKSENDTFVVGSETLVWDKPFSYPSIVMPTFFPAVSTEQGRVAPVPQKTERCVIC